MIRDSFPFYRSFYDLILTIDDKDKITLINTICEYGLNGNLIESNPLINSYMIVIKPIIDSNNEKYLAAIEGGKSKGKRKGKSTARTNVNVNDEVNDYDNENTNINDNLIVEFAKELNRSLSKEETNNIKYWIIEYGEEAVRFALRSAVINKAFNFPYIEKILQNNRFEQEEY